jgi:hypothetical protein
MGGGVGGWGGGEGVGVSVIGEDIGPGKRAPPPPIYAKITPKLAERNSLLRRAQEQL